MIRTGNSGCSCQKQQSEEVSGIPMRALLVSLLSSEVLTVNKKEN